MKVLGKRGPLQGAPMSCGKGWRIARIIGDSSHKFDS